MGKINSRDKGKRGELEIAHIMQGYGFDARRGQQFSGLQGDADVVGVPYLHLEIKRVQALNLDKAMEQSKRDASVNGDIPTVVHRKDRQEWRVTLTLEDFMPMYMAWLKQQVSWKFSDEYIEPKVEIK
jgi:Holliday junction resolvase